VRARSWRKDTGQSQEVRLKHSNDKHVSQCQCLNDAPVLGSCSEHQRPFGRSSQHLTAAGCLAAAAQKGRQRQLALSWLTAARKSAVNAAPLAAKGSFTRRGEGADAMLTRHLVPLCFPRRRAFRSRKHFSRKSHTAPPWSQLQLAW